MPPARFTSRSRRSSRRSRSWRSTSGFGCTVARGGASTSRPRGSACWASPGSSASALRPSRPTCAARPPTPQWPWPRGAVAISTSWVRGLRRFQRGQWSLRAQVAGRDAYLEAVRLGRAHVAVTAAVAPKPEDLIVRSLRTVSSMLAFPADQAWSPRWRWRPTVGIAHRRPVGLV